MADVRKHYVIDTNVILHNPNSLFLFDEHELVIPFTVLEELDKFKKQNDEVGRNARAAIRHLDALRSQGHLGEGVTWNDEGGRIRVDFGDETRGRPGWLKQDVPDNRILGVAWDLIQRGKHAVFISKDINVRIKSDAIGIPTEDFEAEKVDADHLYPGYQSLDVPTDLIDSLYNEKQLLLETIEPHLPASASPLAQAGPRPLWANEFLQLRDTQVESHTGLARRLADTDHLIPIHAPRKPISGILARNVQQTMALDLLMDDEVKLITLIGTAGTGKTLLALAAGVAKVFSEKRYDKLLVARPIMPMGRDIGFLPGDKDEKLTAWMQPIFDNMLYLLSNRGASGGVSGDGNRPPEQRLNQMIAAGQLVLEPLTYIRGRSIPHQFIVIDEAQNLSPQEVKTIVSRVGEGTKIILTGDVSQIDHPYLDASSNGLSFMIERLKNQPIVGHVTLARTERSKLASLAAEML
jgi:PhoH-like ATPase